MTIGLRDRYAGALIGAASGDALGGTLEFVSRAEIERRYPDGFREIVGGGWMRLAPGETTDDTAMMLGIARACTPDGIDLDAVAANFVAWMRSGPKDIGNATRAALRMIADGVEPQDAGERLQERTPEGVAGNGSVMRCAPVALRFRSDPTRRTQAAGATSRMTHADPRATWGCVAVCNGLAHLLDGGSRGEVLAAATEGVGEPRVVEAVRAAADLPYGEVRAGGYVLHTITAAFWALLHEDSAEAVIVRAVMMGEDTDSTATVAGALAGAHWGVEAIPARWRNVVHHREELDALATSLLAWDQAHSTLA
jgi:ADP-ribosyl-[dinitrogen reductase] hydrolase